MKKVLVFLLVLALALGCLSYAHAAVTQKQEELTFYPTEEIGDPAVLEGMTVSTTITCGSHLRWESHHTFGGETVTEFAYSREPIREPSSVEGHMFVSLLDEEDVMHTGQFHSLIVEAPTVGSITRKVPVHEMISDYSPNFRIDYLDEAMECERAFFNLDEDFRFPVSEEDIASISITQDGNGSTERSVLPQNGLDLLAVYDMNPDGVWFLLQFQDENGIRPYESPSGHGVYFLPWRSLGKTSSINDLPLVKPDLSRLELSVPLDEGFSAIDLMVSPEQNLIHLLTLQEGMYLLSTYDLNSGALRSRLELLSDDTDDDPYSFFYPYHGDQLLLQIGAQFFLTDAAGETILLTAPIHADQNFGIGSFDPRSCDLYFDGQTLFVTGLINRSDAVFVVTAWSEGTRTYYGTYDCSLTQSEVDWYYSNVEAQGLAFGGSAPGEEG